MSEEIGIKKLIRLKAGYDQYTSLQNNRSSITALIPESFLLS
jgi:hypothetical protein